MTTVYFNTNMAESCDRDDFAQQETSVILSWVYRVYRVYMGIQGIQGIHGYTGYTWVYRRMDILLLLYETLGLFGVSVT